MDTAGETAQIVKYARRTAPVTFCWRCGSPKSGLAWTPVCTANCRRGSPGRRAEARRPNPLLQPAPAESQLLPPGRVFNLSVGWPSVQLMNRGLAGCFFSAQISRFTVAHAALAVPAFCLLFTISLLRVRAYRVYNAPHREAEMHQTHLGFLLLLSLALPYAGFEQNGESTQTLRIVEDQSGAASGRGWGLPTARRWVGRTRERWRIE